MRMPCNAPHAGLALRMPCTFLVMYGGGFSVREKLFFALAWLPKARCCLHTSFPAFPTS
jgi:hypothetical protein